MRYDINSVGKLPLSAGLCNSFCKELFSLYGYHTVPGTAYYNTHEALQIALSSFLIYNRDYYTLEINDVENLVKRTKKQLDGKFKDGMDDKILELWLKYANQMTDFEKIMAGWDKL